MKKNRVERSNGPSREMARVSATVPQPEGPGGEPILSTADAAEALGISERRVRALCAEGRMGRQVGTTWVITPEDIEANRVRKPGKPRGASRDSTAPKTAMPTLRGTPEDIALATEIRALYSRVSVHLRKAVEILRDEAKVTVTLGDPINGLERRVEIYARKITNQQEACFSAAGYWRPCGTIGYIVRRRKELEASGCPFSYRQPTAELYAETLEALEKSLATEEDARFWIERWPRDDESNTED